MKIAIGGIHTECSTYSPLAQTMDDFTVVRGPDLIAQCGLGGDAFPGIDFHPLFHARSIPGGAVEPECYAAFKSRFLDQLSAAIPVNGVLLIMHGAMFVPGLDDPEGDWITAVRKLVGPDVPIAVSYDLHGNVSRQIVDQIDIFCAYRTAPHIDVIQTHRRAAGHLVDQICGGPRRFVAFAPVPVLVPGEKSSTVDEPAKSLYAALPAVDRRVGVCDANLMVGYVWADAARATAAAVVTGTDRQVSLQAATDLAESYWAARAQFDFGVPAMPLDACLNDAAAATSTPFILADSGDNPTGGGVGDRADVLSAWLERGLEDAVFAGIADPLSVERAWPHNEGDRVALTIGGALGSGGRTAHASATLRRKLGTTAESDREVLVDVGGNQVILTERRRPFHDLADFHRYGLDPATARFIVVKSGYLSPELSAIANPARMALTDGAVNQDIAGLSNLHRPSPCYPFQTHFDWKANARLSARAQD